MPPLPLTPKVKVAIGFGVALLLAVIAGVSVAIAYRRAITHVIQPEAFRPFQRELLSDAPAPHSTVAYLADGWGRYVNERRGITFEFPLAVEDADYRPMSNPLLVFEDGENPGREGGVRLDTALRITPREAIVTPWLPLLRASSLLYARRSRFATDESSNALHMRVFENVADKGEALSVIKALYGGCPFTDTVVTESETRPGTYDVRPTGEWESLEDFGKAEWRYCANAMIPALGERASTTFKFSPERRMLVWLERDRGAFYASDTADEEAEGRIFDSFAFLPPR